MKQPPLPVCVCACHNRCLRGSPLGTKPNCCFPPLASSSMCHLCTSAPASSFSSIHYPGCITVQSLLTGTGKIQYAMIWVPDYDHLCSYMNFIKSNQKMCLRLLQRISLKKWLGCYHVSFHPSSSQQLQRESLNISFFPVHIFQQGRYDNISCRLVKWLVNRNLLPWFNNIHISHGQALYIYSIFHLVC